MLKGGFARAASGVYPRGVTVVPLREPSAPARAEGLLKTKLTPPRMRPDLVGRPRLSSLLEDGRWRPLALLCAPAGAGKTTLARQWLAETEADVAWLSLDEGDNDLARLLRYIDAAVAPYTKRQGRSAEPPPSLDALPLVVEGLLEPIGDRERALVLVLDDAHLLASSEAQACLAALVDTMPPPGQVLLTCRDTPPLPLAKLRARDEVTEVTMGELRFSVEEAGAFLAGRGDGWTDEAVAELCGRLDGWAAGLQLCALTGRGKDPSAVASIDRRRAAAFLTEEVLDALDDDLRGFLIATSSLPRLSAALCDAALGRSDSASLLAEIERKNLFLIALDDEGEWFRYHHLFAQLLLDHLLDDERREIEGRAALFFHDAGAGHEAVELALSSRSPAIIRPLLHAWGFAAIMRSDLQTAGRWLSAAGPDVVDGDPRLVAMRGWHRVLTFDTGALQRLAAGEGLADPALAAEEDRTFVRSHAAAIDAYVRRMTGDDEGALAAAEAMLAAADDVEDSALAPVALLAGDLLAARDRIADAETAYDIGAGAGLRSGNIFAGVGALTSAALLASATGELERGLAWCDRSIAACGADDVSAVALSAVGLRAQLLLTDGDIDGAVELTTPIVQHLRRMAEPTVRLGYHLFFARVAAWRYEREAAAEELAQLDDVADRLPPSAMADLITCRVHIALAFDDLDEARRALDAASDAPLDDVHSAHGLLTSRLRVAVRAGENDVADRLRAAAASAASAGRHAHAAELAVVAALVGDKLDPGVLEAAMVQARDQHVLGMLLADRGLLAEALPRLPAGEGRDILSAWLASCGPPARERERPAPAKVGYETVSVRELEVLGLLANGLSNREIGRKLFVSVGTVKTHVHNLLAKLSARNRTDAVRIGREQGLLKG